MSLCMFLKYEIALFVTERNVTIAQKSVCYLCSSIFHVFFVCKYFLHMLYSWAIYCNCFSWLFSSFLGVRLMLIKIVYYHLYVDIVTHFLLWQTIQFFKLQILKEISTVENLCFRYLLHLISLECNTKAATLTCVV